MEALDISASDALQWAFTQPGENLGIEGEPVGVPGCGLQGGASFASRISARSATVVRGWRVPVGSPPQAIWATCFRATWRAWVSVSSP